MIELIRVSTESQASDDRASIPAQRSVNRQTCARYSLEIVKSIEFSDVSGANVLAAPEIRTLLSLIEAEDIHGVVTREFSRLMRPERWTDYALLQSFIDTNTILYTESGPLDLDSDHGRMVGGMSAIMAGIERRQILKRIWAAKESKRRSGELGQSRVVLPYGVGYENGRGFFYKPEAERVLQAFRRFLAGEHNYISLSKLVGVTPRGMHLILRNPIWTGWRVIDKKRDTSATGKYIGVNGRQTDRRKIRRAPEDIIRVKVIECPLISEADFQTVQRIMDQKQARHWRADTNREHRWIYNGFLTCSVCNNAVYTRLARRDYYVCSNNQRCGTKYMSRERLDSALDHLFSERLLGPPFLAQCIDEIKKRSTHDDSELRMERARLELKSLENKRSRIVESFIEGVIEKADRDARLAKLDRSIAHLSEVTSPVISMITASSLIEALAPLTEFAYLNREQKRAILSSLVPDIRVADYKIESLGLNPSLFSNDETRSPAVISMTAVETAIAAPR